MNFLHDLRRRRMFRLVGLYIVGAWVVIQVAEQLFQAWGVPETANRFIFIAAALCFPIALVFGWVFDITSEGIVRTSKASAGESVSMRLQKTDYAILAALAAIGVFIVLGSAGRIQEEIESGRVAATSVEKRPNAIAVLPFKNLDIKAETGYFSEGITEEILHRLSTLGALHVLASSSSFGFGDSNLTPAEISDTLGVSYLLDGSIRRDNDFVRVTARLLDGSGYQIWSEAFDRELSEIFAVQSEIARSVSQEIINEIVPLQALPAGRTTENMEAYNQYLLGRHAFRNRTEDWKQTAESAFSKAIELDPGFAPPYAGLATLVVNSNRGPHWNEALETAGKALELDPELAEGHAIVGLITTVLGDPVAGAESLEYALELDPSQSTAYEWLAASLRRQDRIEEASAVRQRGLAVDPLTPILVANTADTESYRGNFSRAEQLYLRIASLPEISGPATSILQFYEEWGRYDRLLDITKQFGLKVNDRDYVLSNLAQAYARLGMPGEADYWYSRMISVHPTLEGSAWETYQLFSLYDDRKRIREQLRLVQPDEGNDVGVYASSLGYGALAHINAGNYAKGVEWIDTSLKLFHDLYRARGRWAGINVEFFRRHWPDRLVFPLMQHVAFAYRQVDRHEEANDILEQVGQALDEYDPMDPQRFEWFALQSALLSDMDRTHEYLSQAVDIGWANYHEVANDPAWQIALQDERIAALLDIAKERVREQREKAKALEASEDFKAEMERLLRN